MYQFYVVEVQKHEDGEFGHIVHWAFDEDFQKARNKGESKYHEVLAAAAISDLPEHGAILFGSDCQPLMDKCYKHGDTNEQTNDRGCKTW